MTWPDRPAQVPRSEGRDPAVQCSSGLAVHDHRDPADSSPRCSKAVRMASASSSVTTNIAEAWVIGPPPASTSGSDSPPVVFSRVAAWLARHPRRAFRARSLIPSISSVLKNAAGVYPDRRDAIIWERRVENAGVGWIAAIIIGGLAGWLAEKFMKSEMGLFMNIVLGIVGAAVASAILSVVGINLAGWIGYLIAGFVGACLLIWIVRAFKKA